MKRLDFIRRAPWITDYNLLVETINKLIDKQEQKIEVEPIVINREVKDFWFFNNEEVPLPYEAYFTIYNTDIATDVFNKYVLSFDEMKAINKALEKGKIVSLSIFVKELITDKEEKQEAVFETINTEVVTPIEEPEEKKEAPKKRWRKKTKWK